MFVNTQKGTMALRIGTNSVRPACWSTAQARLDGSVLANYQPGILGKSYTLVTATGGYTGTFGTLATTGTPAFLMPASATAAAT